MVLTWYGQSCFKIQAKNVVILTDPFGKETGLRSPRLNADVLLLSSPDYYHEKLKESPALKINGPGEYEIKGNMIHGILSAGKNIAGQKTANTIYSMTIDGIDICHLGHLSEPLTSEQLEEIGDADILLTPIAGTYTIDADQAVKIINQLEPQYAIPMHYKIPQSKVKQDAVNDFCEEFGIDKKGGEDSLRLKAKDLENEEMKAVLLKPIGG